MLQENTPLNSLCLTENKIDKTGAKQLSQALIKNMSLKTLILNGNPISPDGVVEISAALKKNKSLARLALSETGFEEKGFLAVIDALENNCTLKKVHFRLDWNSRKNTYNVLSLSANTCKRTLNVFNQYLSKGLLLEIETPDPSLA